jgi:hypothetical protein
VSLSGLCEIGMQSTHAPFCSQACVDLQFGAPVFDNPTTPSCTPGATATWCPLAWAPPGFKCPDSFNPTPTRQLCLVSSDIRPGGNYPGGDCEYEMEYPPGSGIKYRRGLDRGCCMYREGSLDVSADPLSPGALLFTPDGVGVCNDLACGTCEM